MNLKTTGLFAVLVLAWTFVAAADDAWTEDIAAAIKTAEKEDKDLLLLYTGSDWCPPCKKLEADILSQEEFLEDAGSKYVLVKFDFPQSSEQSEELVTQNQEWLKKYGIDGYPTIVLIDSDQRPFGFAGYESGSVGDYLDMLESLRQIRVRRDKTMKEADKLKGLDRARMLDQAISEMRQEVVSIYYEDIVTEIVELDSKDELGLRTKWNESKDNELRKIILADITMVARLEKPDRALQYINNVMDDVVFPSTQKLQILQIKLNLLQKTKNLDEVNAVLDEMINLDGVDGTIRERLIIKKVLTMAGNGQRDEAMKMLDDALADGQDNLFMCLAKGELLDSEDKFREAVESYDLAIPKAGYNPDLLADLVGAKADALVELNETESALQLLDNFVDDAQMPSDLRAEILLHKAMIHRDQGRRRFAILDENRAVQICEPSQQTEMQKVVDQLSQKYEKKENQ